MWKIQEDIRTATDTIVDKYSVSEHRHQYAIVENLQKETVYVLRVLGTSWGGEGQKSEAVYFTVLGKRFLRYCKVYNVSTVSNLPLRTPEMKQQNADSAS